MEDVGHSQHSLLAVAASAFSLPAACRGLYCRRTSHAAASSKGFMVTLCICGRAGCHCHPLTWAVAGIFKQYAELCQHLCPFVHTSNNLRPQDSLLGLQPQHAARERASLPSSCTGPLPPIPAAVRCSNIWHPVAECCAQHAPPAAWVMRALAQMLLPVPSATIVTLSVPLALLASQQTPHYVRAT